MTPVGKTRQAGWQIGVSITLHRPAGAVWDFLTSAEGLAVWLGPGVVLAGTKGERYETKAGTAGEIRSFRPGDRIRLTWKPADWDHETTVQIALDERGPKTGVRFHQERLADAEQREGQRAHWREVAERVRAAMSA